MKNEVFKENAQRKRDLFVNVLKEEFLRELHYVWEIVNKRAAPRDTLAQQLVKPLLTIGGVIPAIVSVLSVLGEVAVFSANPVRDRHLQMAVRLNHELDWDRLTTLVDVVAREALRRYESFIVDRLCDDPERGVIPFAKCGARRMVENLTHYHREIQTDQKTGQIEILLSESLLLAGLIEGRSGAWVEGFSNHHLVLKKTQTNWLGRETATTVEAEDVYGRAGFRHFEMKEGKLIDALYVRDKAKHQDSPQWQKLKQTVKGERELFENFGYVRFCDSKDHRQDPKVGFVIMPLSVMRSRYDFKPQEHQHFSRELQAELRASSHSLIQVDKGTFACYVEWSKTLAGQGKSLVTYVQTVLNYPLISQVICSDDLSDLPLTGLDLNHTDLSGAALGGDLSGTDLSESYLVGTDCRAVTSAKGLILRGAHCEYLQAPKVDFQGSDFTQAHFSYANLAGANLMGCKVLGALWTGADLRGVSDNQDLVKQQTRDIQRCQLAVQEQQQQYRQVEQLIFEQSQQLQEIRSTFVAHIKKQSTSRQSETQQRLDSLSLQIQQLAQQHEDRLTFEAHCQEELHRLQTILAQTADEKAIQQLQTQLQTVQYQLHTLVQGEGFQEALKDFQQECKESLQHVTKESASLAEGLKSLEERFTRDCQAQLKQQGVRLHQLEQRVSLLEKDLQQQLSQIKDRLSALEQWAMETKQTLKEEKQDKDQIKGSLIALAEAVNRLMSERTQGLQRRLMQKQQVRHIEYQIIHTTQSEEVQGLKAQLEQIQKQWEETKTPDHRASVMAPLQRLQKEFAEQKETLERAAKYNAVLKKSMQGTLAQLEKRQQATQDLLQSFEQRWALQSQREEESLKDLREFLTQTYSACDIRIEELNRRMTSLEKWAGEANGKINHLTQDQVELKYEVETLKQELSHLITQQRTQREQQRATEHELKELRHTINQTTDSHLKPTLEKKLQALEKLKERGVAPIPSSIQMEEQLLKLKTYYTEQATIMRNSLAFVEEEAKKDLEIAQADIQKKLAELTEISTSLKTKQEEQQKANEHEFAGLKQQLEETRLNLSRRMEALEHQVDEVKGQMYSVKNDVDDLRNHLDMNDPLYTVGVRLKTLREKILTDSFIQDELAYYVAPNGQAYEGDYSEPLLPWVQKHFLQQPKARLLVLKGPGGAGKTTFNRFLYRQLWSDPAWDHFKPGMVPSLLICFFIPLSSPRVNPRRLLDFLRDLPELEVGFTSDEIDLLKSFPLLLITDAYDELPEHMRVNLFTTNGFEDKHLQVKLLMSCRKGVFDSFQETTYLMPTQLKDPVLYQQYHIAPFSDSQISDYISQYLASKRSKRKESLLWEEVATYREYFKKIKGINEIISIPFMLMITVERLPLIVKEVEQEEKDINKGKIELTQKKLLESFVKGWLDRQTREKALPQRDFLKNPTSLLGEERIKQLTATTDLTVDLQRVFLETACWLFCQKLAKNLQKEKRFSVIYPPLEEKITSLLSEDERPVEVKSPTWSKILFDPSNSDMACCIRHSPLRRIPVGHGRNEFCFIHALLRDYFATVLVEHQAEQRIKNQSIPTLSLPQSLPLSDGQALLLGLPNIVLGASRRNLTDQSSGQSNSQSNKSSQSSVNLQ